MFEKEAEEYCGNLDESKTRDFITDAFKDGAEYGYNKANEWHYVKDGKYPKEKQLVMVYRVNPLGANIAITNWYDSYKDTKVIAWKEIVLPKEIE
jgi:hypothetical protein